MTTMPTPEQRKVLDTITAAVRANPRIAAAWTRTFATAYDLSPLEVTNAVRAGRGMPPLGELPTPPAGAPAPRQLSTIPCWRDVRPGDLVKFDRAGWLRVKYISPRGTFRDYGFETEDGHFMHVERHRPMTVLTQEVKFN